MKSHFGKTYSNIYGTIMLTVAILVCTVLLSGGITVAYMLHNTYITMAEQKIDRSVTSCKNYVNSVMQTVAALAKNENIISAASGENRSVTSELDKACEYAAAIDGITVYSSNGRAFTSSSLSGEPALSALKGLEELADFFADDDDYVFMRTTPIAAAYEESAYDANKGMLSCCRKIYSGGLTVGYVFADVFPERLYKYFDYSGTSYDGSVSRISFSNGFFKTAQNEGYEAYFSDGNSKSGKYVVITSTRNFFGGTAAVAVPLVQSRLTALYVSLVLIASGLCILFTARLFAKSFANRLVKRLDGLLDKFNSEIR